MARHCAGATMTDGTGEEVAALLQSVGARAVEPHRVLRGHDFFPPPEELAQIPALYATDGVPLARKTIMLHYFTAGCDWWICELDRRSGTAFGYACLGKPEGAEWGYVDLYELCRLAIPTLSPVVVQRDLDWHPTPVAQCHLPGHLTSVVYSLQS
jgi:hypothetical protein